MGAFDDAQARALFGVGHRVTDASCFVEHQAFGEPWLRQYPLGHVLETTSEQVLPVAARTEVTTPTGRWQAYWWSSRFETLRTVADMPSPPTQSYVFSLTGR